MSADPKTAVLSELLKKGGPMSVGALLVFAGLYLIHTHVVSPMVASQVALAEKQTAIVVQQKEIAGALQQTAATLKLTAKTLEATSSQTADLYRMMREDMIRARSNQAVRP